jgi:hypothetical protein
VMNIKRAGKLFYVFAILILASLACGIGSVQNTPTSNEILGPPTSDDLKVILQRLEVLYLGQDSHKVIGSGCPGNDGKGTIENYHFVVKGVDRDRKVRRVLVAGDNSTLTWEWPCSDNWGLQVQNMGDGVWEVFIAPSLPTEMYTLIFFYDDNTMALGMVEIR